MDSNPVYLDHAATSPIRPEVLEAMLPYLGGTFGNPSSAHRFGRVARAGVESARREVAAALGVEPAEVVFTSGGTEADNLAVIGASLAAQSRGGKAFAAVSASEHKAVLAAAHAVRELGGEEEILPVDRQGLLDLDRLDRVLGLGPAVVSVMWVNNETGVIQPVREIGERCRAAGVVFHSDLVQAFGKLPIRLDGEPIGLASISGHKIGAPKGIGALIVREKGTIRSTQHGGGQQGGVRPGTENVAGIVGLGRAAALASSEVVEEGRRLAGLRDRLAEALRAGVPDLVVTAEEAPRAPHVLNILVPGGDSEALLLHLDLAGVAVSSGSTCTTGAIEPSHVLTAMGVPHDLAVGAVRFSLGRETTEADIARASEVFPAVVARVRRLAGLLGEP